MYGFNFIPEFYISVVGWNSFMVCHENVNTFQIQRQIYMRNITNMYQGFFHYHWKKTLTVFQKQSAFEMLCLCAVITEKVLVRISKITHVKPLSKHFTVQMEENRRIVFGFEPFRAQCT